jgi:uncharacterized protein YndB with AHSA1/START domain
MPDLPVFEMTRNFSASPETVWKAWTDPAQFTAWLGPAGCKVMIKTMDLKPGGVLHSCLTMPIGGEMWAKFVYRDVTPPKHISWEHSFSDKDGNITRHPSHAIWPLKLITDVGFEREGNGTKLTLTWTPLEATPEEVASFTMMMPTMNMGWSGTFDQLDAFLKK